MTGPALLKAWREKKGLTQRQVAEALDTDATAISRWENGDRPALVMAHKIDELTKGACPMRSWAVGHG